MTVPAVAAINLSMRGNPVNAITIPETRSLTPSEVMTMRPLAKTLSGQWRLETTQNDENGQVFAGLVAPRRDKFAYLVMLEGIETGITASWWTGAQIASGDPEDVFNAIRGALSEGQS
jgi:hypothetical protein